MRYAAMLLTTLLMLASLSGCSAVGFAASALGGPTVHDPKYAPTSRPTVVLVDNYRTKVPTTSLRDAVSTLLTEELKEHNVAPIVPQYKVYDLRAASPAAFRQMRIEQVARAVGAEQVIYVDVLDAGVASTMGDQLLKGGISVTIKVVDGATGETLWPKQFDDGYPFTIEMRYTPSGADVNNESIQGEMARQTADGIAKLFYKYTTDD